MSEDSQILERLLTPVRAKMLGLHRTGMTSVNIAKECGVSSMAVSKFLSLIGLKPNKRKQDCCERCKDKEGHWIDRDHVIRRVDLKVTEDGRTLCKICRLTESRMRARNGDDEVWQRRGIDAG